MATMSNTVILGAGVIGVSTAYFLSSSGQTVPNTIHLVEASPTLFASASGYAGGFLAKDWFGPATAELGALSFDLHKQLAEEHGGRERWGYSLTKGASMVNAFKSDRVQPGRAEVAGKHEYLEGDGPSWVVKKKGRKIDIMSSQESTAQVDPLRLCKFLLGECLDRGVRLHHPAHALSISKDMRGELASVRIAKEGGEEMDLPCSRLVITAGAWTAKVFSGLFSSSMSRIPITSLAGHSIVVRSERWTPEMEKGGCHALFATESDGISPELFSRIGGEIYVAGLNDASLPLPSLATDAKPIPSEIERLKKATAQIIGLPEGGEDLKVERAGLCFRPVTARGPPFLTRVHDSKLGDGLSTRGGADGGVFLSAGHGPWGISQSLGTGKVLAEMIENQKTSADVSMLTL